MHHALVLSVFSSTFLVLTTFSGTTLSIDTKYQLPSGLRDELSMLENQGQLQRSDIRDDLLPRAWWNLEDELEKRGWKDIAPHWGKRAMGERAMGERPGLGKRAWADLQGYGDKRAWGSLKGGSWGKRDWSQFQGGWGKRDKHYMGSHLVRISGRLNDDEENENDQDDLDETAWQKPYENNLKDKRDPAWSNLKGLWGKRVPKTEKPFVWRIPKRGK